MVTEKETIGKHPGLLLILTGPTAAGKTEVNKKILQNHPEIKKLVTTTTRSPRSDEQNGIHYHFRSREDFLRGVADGEFLESAEYGGSLYGTTKKEIDAILEGQSLVSAMEMSGALNFENNIKKSYASEIADSILKRTVIIFIGVDSLFTLRQRFLDRGNSRDALLRRLRTDWSMWKKNQDNFPNIVINTNGNLTNTVSQVEQLISLKS